MMPGGEIERDRTRIQARLGVSPAQARVLYALYAADGEVVLADDLLTVCSQHWDVGPEVLKVQISYARRKVGRDAILNVWSRGYRLSDGGLATIRGALS